MNKLKTLNQIKFKKLRYAAVSSLIVRKEDRVQQCYYVTGEGDFTLICTVRDMEDFEDLTHELFINNANVKRFRTAVVMESTK